MKSPSDHTNSNMSPDPSRDTTVTSASNWPPELAIRYHYQLLGHSGSGITELRMFDRVPMVVYVDSVENFVRLALQFDGKVAGIYAGVQPRPLHLFEKAPNCWQPAHAAPYSNCACDRDIEFVTTCFWDIDVLSPERQVGHPASEPELQNSLQAARLLTRENGLARCSTIGCSGNGHYVLVPIQPIPVDDEEIPIQFRRFCQQLADIVATQVSQVKLDPVFNLSRVMRIMGTTNQKGKAIEQRPYRRAHFVTPPLLTRSEALHHMILNTDIPQPVNAKNNLSYLIQCDLQKLNHCEFIQWCRKFPTKVSEQQWFGLITNLALLQGGAQLIHEISSLDPNRYNYQETQSRIERIWKTKYQPIPCTKLAKPIDPRNDYGGFNCSQIRDCPARAPMHLATLRTIYQR